MRERNSLSKKALIIILLYLKEGYTTDVKAAVEIRCSGQNICNDSTSTPFFCRCDEKCSLYKDCCTTPPNRTDNIHQPVECSSFGVYLISSCQNKDNVALNKMCLEPWHPMFSDIPVIDLSSGFSYRNGYCAMCNGADEHRIVSWRVHFDCSSAFKLLDFYNRSELWEMIEFDNHRKAWGIKTNWADENRFYHCILHPERHDSPELTYRIRNCHPFLISSCPNDWEDEEYKENCHKIHSPIFHNYTLGFKNIFCAVCNNLSLSDINCDLSTLSAENFRVFLDLVGRDGLPKCKEGEQCLVFTPTLREQYTLMNKTLFEALLFMKEALNTDSKKTVEVNCTRQHDCNDFTSTPFFCRCDEKCSLYGDCCATAPNQTHETFHPFQCSSLGVYMISSCQNKEDAALNKMCAGTWHTLSFVDMPVVDRSSGITYRNYYCAMCNGADENRTVFWSTHFDCSGAFELLEFYNKSELREMIEFDHEIRVSNIMGGWGIKDNRSGESKFYTCFLRQERPYAPELSLGIRYCFPYMISSCPYDWKDEEVKEKCLNIHAPVFPHYMLGFKNIYCAVCNNFSLSDIKCDLSTLTEGNLKKFLDILIMDWRSECKEGEECFMYTPDKKKLTSMLKDALNAALLYVKKMMEAQPSYTSVTEENKCSRNHDCLSLFFGFSRDLPCKCDDKCSLYGDCCPNAPNRIKNDSQPFECSTFGVYMISRCPNETEIALKEMCESGPSPYEISLGIPAIDVSSGFTYRNYYCAMCNGADETDIILWSSHFECEGTSNLHFYYRVSELREMVQYDFKEGKWGIHDNRSDQNRFYPCHLSPEIPTSRRLAHSIRECNPNLISTCSDDWEDGELEDKCHTFHAPVYHFRSFEFKNINCALCNNIPLSDIECNLKIPYSGFDGVHSFKILVDVNLEDDESKCKEGEILFDNKCKKLDCGFPNLVRRKGKCVPKGL